MNTNNIQGLVKTPRYEKPSDSNQALNIAGNAATGFQMGSKLGVPGMIAGTVAGAGLGLIENQAAEREASLKNETIDNHNKFVDSMEGRTAQRQYVSPMQARYGLKNKQGSLDVEVQKNEVKLGKDGSIQSIYKASAKHDDTRKRKTVTTLEEGEKIIPTNTDDELSSFLRLHNKATVGDKKAKSQLKKIYEDLPSPTEAKGEQKLDTYHNIKAQEGVSNPGYKDPIGNIADRFGIDDGVDISKLENWKTKTRKGDPYTYRYDGKNTVQAKEENTKDWITPKDYSKASEAIRGVFGLPPESKLNASTEGSEENPTTSELKSQNAEDPLSNIDFETFDSMSDELSKLGREESGESDIVLNDEKSIPGEEGAGGEEGEDFETFNNPLKYANAAYNFYRGSQNAERQNRRYDTAEPMQYKDTSEQARKDVRLSRRQMAENLRGKGLSAGQIQALSSQQAVAGNRQLEKINAREANIAFKTNRYNTQLGNQTGAANTAAARQYDLMDLKADAAKRSYTAAGFNELPKHADLFEQRQYATQKDQKAYDTESAYIKAMNTDNFKWTKDGKYKETF